MTNKELIQEQIHEIDCIDDNSFKGWSDEQLNKLMTDIIKAK